MHVMTASAVLSCDGGVAGGGGEEEEEDQLRSFHLLLYKCKERTA